MQGLISAPCCCYKNYSMAASLSSTPPLIFNCNHPFRWIQKLRLAPLDAGLQMHAVLFSHPTFSLLRLGRHCSCSLLTSCAFSAFSATLAFSLPSLPSRRACLSTALAMSRKLDQELVTRAKVKGYWRETHKKKDKVRNRHKHVSKTKKDHNAALNRYVL
jgi:hypothetical protein